MQHLENGRDEPISKVEIRDTDTDNKCIDTKAGMRVEWTGRLGLTSIYYYVGLPRWCSCKESTC